MENSHDFKTLTANTNGYIGYCPCCKKYNLAYKNSLFIFNEFEFGAFQDMLEKRIGIHDFYTSHGKELMLRTPLMNYYILLKEAEIEEMLNMMDDVSLLLKAHRRVNVNKN